jgi:hypothetical protein
MITIIKQIIGLLLQIRIDLVSNLKIKQIRSNVIINSRNKKLENDYKKTWRKLGKTPSILFLNLLKSINGIESHLYVPENIHYGIIEPKLNNKAYALTFNDKNFFERYLSNFNHHFPKTVLRGINGVLHDENYKRIDIDQTYNMLNQLSKNEHYILKPATETGGGDNVLLIIKEKTGFSLINRTFDTGELIAFLKFNYKNNFVLQSRIIQHPWFQDFNSSSVNTIRLYAYRSVKDEKVHPFHAYIRFGNDGSLVDSSSQGGRTCGISSDGILNNFALGKYGEKFEDIKCVLEKKGTVVPHFNEMKKIAIEIARSYFYHRLLGFDFCVDENDKIKLLEINTLNVGIINQQMNSGPLFRDFTHEVIEYCNTHKKSVVLDFYV